MRRCGENRASSVDRKKTCPEKLWHDRGKFDQQLGRYLPDVGLPAVILCGFYHFGLIAESAGAEGQADTPHKTKQLIEGLWYYAEDGKIPPPK